MQHHGTGFPLAGLVLVGLLLTGGQILLLAFVMTVGRGLPVGDQLLYEVRTLRTSDIYLLDIDRQLTYNLTRPRQYVLDSRPIWSPDGRQMVFESRQDRITVLYLFDVANSQLRPLAPQITGNQYRPLWTADSRKLIFQAHSRFDPQTYRMDTQTGALEALTGTYPPPATPAPGRLLVMVYRDNTWGIGMYDDQRNLAMLTDNNVRFNEPPRWSPDEQQVALVAGEYGFSDIYVMNADGGNFRRVTQDGALKTNLIWRPR